MDQFANKKEYNGIWGIWDEPFFSYYVKEMNQMKQPFMTALFSVTSHHPFKVPEQYEGVYPKGTLPVHQCVGYTDNALRRFFNEASQMEWYKNTLFVITANHSSASHFESSRNTPGRFAIPLIFYSPFDEGLVGWDDGIAQQIDIMPTVLNYLNFNDPYIAFGNDLFDKNTDRFVVNYVNQNYQYFDGDTILHYDGTTVNGLYHYHTDSLLHNNLKTEVLESKQQEKCQAIIQQYNMRMIKDQLIVQ